MRAFSRVIAVVLAALIVAVATPVLAQEAKAEKPIEAELERYWAGKREMPVYCW